ncbi:MAG: FkbM family methyltransferase [Christensenella sp.]
MNLKETDCLWEHLSRTDKPIVLYGMGDGADKILGEFARRGIHAAGVFASDEFCRGQKFRGFEVLNYADAQQRFGEMLVLVAFGTRLETVINRIKKIAQEQELYVPDVPVCGGDVFDDAYYKAHAAEFKSVYEMLEDELSRNTFCNMIDYKLSGKPKYLFECESDISSAYSDVLRLGAEESYVDVGAYTGDTIREFVSECGGYKKIFAIEPDKKNFARLAAAVQALKNVECCNMAAQESAGEVAFAQRGGRNSAVSKGENMIPATAIDELIGDERVTYIKYDVEGEELSALSGTRRIIMQQKPKLLVSAYHRNDDLYSIPILVHNMNPHYKIYLRHFPYVPAWDTNYYFV